MPAGLIEQENGVPPRRDLCRNFGEMQVHSLGVAGGEDERRALALLRADRAESRLPLYRFMGHPANAGSAFSVDRAKVNFRKDCDRFKHGIRMSPICRQQLSSIL